MYIILQIPNIVAQNPELSIAMRSRPATPVSTSEISMTQIILARNDRRKVGMDPINKKNEEQKIYIFNFLLNLNLNRFFESDFELQRKMRLCQTDGFQSFSARTRVLHPNFHFAKF